MTIARTRSGTLVGAACGLAWACALRAYMVELAGPESTFDWLGTFFAILAPGVLAGAVLGAASGLPSSSKAALRWAAAAPLLFAVFTLVLPGQFVTLVTTGLGGGAIGVPAAGIAGGYALRGYRRWLRITTGILALTAIAGVVATVPLVGGASLTSPRGAWAGTLVAALMVVLVLGASIPFARLNSRQHGDEPVPRPAAAHATSQTTADTRSEHRKPAGARR
jgi:hypothetical protein